MRWQARILVILMVPIWIPLSLVTGAFCSIIGDEDSRTACIHERAILWIQEFLTGESY